MAKQDPGLEVKKNPNPVKFAACVRELLDTERDYLDDIKIIIDVFKEPTSELDLLEPDDFEAIFLNVEKLYRVHNKLLRFLELFESNEKEFCIGKSFLAATGDISEPYKFFCTNHQRSVTTLNRVIEENESFREFLEDAKSIEECSHQNLESFLIKPVQRICKYPLLFKDILKYSKENDPDNKDLVVALRHIHAVNEYVNDDLKHKMDLDEVVRLGNQMDGLVITHEFWDRIKLTQHQDGSLVEIAGRLIYGGNLTKVKNKKNEERMIFVFKKMCIYAKQSGSRYKVKYQIKIGDLVILKDDDGFTMNFPSSKGKQSLTLQFRWQGENEKKEWSEAFEIAIGNGDEVAERPWFSKYKGSGMGSMNSRSPSTVYRYSLNGNEKSEPGHGETQRPPSINNVELSAISRKHRALAGRNRKANSADIQNTDNMLEAMEELQLERAPPRLKKFVGNLQKENERLRNKLKYEIEQSSALRDRIKKLNHELEEERYKRVDLERKLRGSSKKGKGSIFL